ncbi:MAG: hypothetical protein LBU48_06895 [Coriobacteriales bacterium]|jgi:hypothetical protein|nr:hypothetical protein [Coriobacteriales bacterium]
MTAKSAEKSTAKSVTKSTAKGAKGAKDSNDKQIVFDPSADRATIANQALQDTVILEALIENLSTDVRRIRQFSAAAIGVVSESNPGTLVPYIPQVADALHRPEAQTRWECLDVLTRVVALDPDATDEALSGAESSLYDEESGPARLAAVRFLCTYGALDAARATRIWPLLDEAIQCYHGDPEFSDMLVSVIAFSGGKIGKDVKKSLASRMDFDAKNAKGALKRRAAQIVELCSKK